MIIRFLDGACADIDDAFLWYEDQVVGLGYAFLAALHDAVVLVECHPDGFPVVRGDLRRCLLSRFPYSVFYSIEKGEIVVAAVAHMRRNPGYWENPTKE